MDTHTSPAAARSRFERSRLAWLAAALGLSPLLGVACVPDPAPEWDAARSARAPVLPRGAPATLEETGLYADFAARVVAADVLPYTPAYPLWSDGAAKQRWIRLPAGSAIDGSNADAWRFPTGTKLWKEFAHGRRVETRYLEHAADGSWIYATYVWNTAGTEAVLAPDAGIRGASARGGRVPRGAEGHDVPSTTDCRACHEGAATPVLGFSALQLARADANAPHAERPAPGSVDLDGLVRRGLLAGHSVAETRIEASSARERAALGYLHANCGGCHNATGPLRELGLELDYRLVREPGATAPAIATAVGRGSRLRGADAQVHLRIAPGASAESLLVERMGSRFGALQMPPLGTRHVDADALALVADWIEHDLVAERFAHAAATTSH